MRGLKIALCLGLGFVASCGGDPMTGLDGGPGDAAVVPMDTGVDAGPVELCAAHSDCDNGDYCDGDETCRPGEPGAGADDCLPGTSPCGAGEVCEEDADRCVLETCADPDADGDGDARPACGGNDCDDENGSVHSGAQEVCDDAGLDEDCDPTTNHNDRVGLNDGDRDGDGFVNNICFNVLPDGSENRGTDCDDGRLTVNPTAIEACNERDDDCDGRLDEGELITFHRDVDGDGFGCDPATNPACTDAPVEACAADPGWVLASGDCDDTVRAVNPSSSEICNGRDDDCDGMTDPGCACAAGATQPCGSGVGICIEGVQTCDVAGIWGGCSTALPGTVSESCNGMDDDCDGTTDEGTTVTCYADGDGDGYAGITAAMTEACSCTPGVTTARAPSTGADCNDGNPAVNPTSPEICNMVDDDCDGMIDEGVTLACYTDGDGDGFAPAGATETRTCGVCGGSRTSRSPIIAIDCDDSVSSINPLGAERCNGVDDDCDGIVDPGCACTTGTSETCGIATGVCEEGTRFCVSGAWGPCDGSVGPSAESCNGSDDDCDGTTDEGVTSTYYADSDGDLYADLSLSTEACSAPAGYISLTLADCDDTTGAANPGNLESSYPCDMIDNDCDGTVDEAALTTSPRDGLMGRLNSCYRDRDGDGFGASSGTPIYECTCPTGYVTDNTDCADLGSRAHLVHPGADFQTRGHCSGGTPCTAGGGEDGCYASGCGMFCLCFPGAVEWDYDCDAVEEPEPAVCPRSSGPFPICVGGTVPATAHAAADCGTDVTYATCCLSTCTPTCAPASVAPLGCR